MLVRVCGMEPADTIETNYLPWIGALIVRERPSVIRRLITRSEVEVASANRVEGAVYI